MTADTVGGVWQYAIDLALGLANRNVITTLAVLGPAPSTERAAEASRVPGLTLVTTGLPLEWTASTAAEAEDAARAVARLAQDHEAQIIQLNGPALAASARFSAPVVAVQHSCVATWWAAVKDGPLPDDLRWRADLIAAGLRRADRVVTPSAALSHATQACYGLDRAPIVVHNGRTAPNPAAADDCGDFVFTAGRLWDEGKGLAALDRAAAGLDCRVVAAGSLEAPDGTNRRYGNLHCVGPSSSDAIAGWLAQKPIYVSTALYEPFGLAVLEAAQAGCALVLADIPSFRELWDGAAVFLPPRAEGKIAAALQRVLADPEFRAALGVRALTRARAYTVTAMVDGMAAVYRPLLPASYRGRTRSAA